MGLIIETTKTSLGQSNPNHKLHAVLRRHTATCESHGNRVSDLSCFALIRFLRITESISFIGINGDISNIRFRRIVSEIRAGLREAGRVMGGVLWSSGL